MYLPTVYAEHELSVLHAFIRENPFGIFTTDIECSPYHTIQSTHLPWILDTTDDPSGTELGVLRGHIARANPQAKAMIETLDKLGASGPTTLERDVMILFNNPVHHYVSPKFYQATMSSTKKTAPTWNYSAIQVYGKAKIYYQIDRATTEFLARQLNDLANTSETKIMGHEDPWKVSDAPVSFIERLQKAIIGIEIRIQSMDGKFKMSQELSQGDRDGVISGFENMHSETATKLSEMVKERAQLAHARKNTKS